MSPSLLKCHSCSAALDAADFDEDRGVAHCDHCGSLFALPTRPRREPPPSKRLEIGMPVLMDRAEMGDQLILSRRWFRASNVPGSLFAVFWTVTVLLQDEWLIPFVRVMFTTAGLVMIYAAAALHFNRTWLTAGRESVTVTHAPLPWWGAKQLRTRSIAQLFCHEVPGSGGSAYAVGYVLKDGRRGTLLGHLDSLDEALYIEQEIERFVGIEDEPVAAEVPRG